MNYSMCADIMFVGVGEHGPVWPDTDGIIAAMELAKKNGINGIEFFDWENRDIEKIAAKSKELGIGIQAFCSKGGEFLGNPAKMDAMVSGFEQSIEAAKVLDCKNLIFNGNAYAQDISREEVHAAMVEGLKKVAPLAEANDVIVLVEPVSGGYFTDSAEAFGIIEEVGSKNVVLLYDIFHYQIMEGNICNTIKEHLPLIGHIHGAGAPMRCELTVGELNYTYILNFLREIGYDKCFGLEFFTFENREEKVAASCGILPR